MIGYFGQLLSLSPITEMSLKHANLVTHAKIGDGTPRLGQIISMKTKRDLTADLVKVRNDGKQAVIDVLRRHADIAAGK